MYHTRGWINQEVPPSIVKGEDQPRVHNTGHGISPLIKIHMIKTTYLDQFQD